MGKLLDELFATAETRNEWLLRDNKVSKEALNGRPLPLPAPYNRRNGTLEADVMRQVEAVLRLTPGLWYRRIEGSGKLLHAKGEAIMVKSSMTGMPDFVAVHDGTFLGIEVKACGGSLSAPQVHCLNGIVQSGGIGIVCVDASLLASFMRGDGGHQTWGKLTLL